MNKVHSLIDKIYHSANLKMAWEQAKKNKGVEGVDNETIMNYENKIQ